MRETEIVRYFFATLFVVMVASGLALLNDGIRHWNPISLGVSGIAAIEAVRYARIVAETYR